MSSSLIKRLPNERNVRRHVALFQTELDQTFDADGLKVLSPEAMIPDYWAQRRRSPTAADRALKGSTLEWLVSLPRQIRPDATVDRYARVVNQLADAWNSPISCRVAFDALLHDKRPGRKGFPPDVRRELKILRFHRANTPFDAA